MHLLNVRFYALGKMFWDERAATLEQQVLMPIQDTTEMGMTLTDLVTKLARELIGEDHQDDTAIVGVQWQN